MNGWLRHTSTGLSSYGRSTPAAGCPGEQLETVLNEHAAQGWQLKFLTRAGGGGLNNLRIFLTFERQID
jgi:Domain of unknown function (DUF4177)